MLAIWLSEPASVLLVARGEDHPHIPYVRRIARADYWQAVGNQAGYNRNLRDARVVPVDHMRLNVHCPHVLTIEHGWRGVRYAVASPLLSIGLLWTARGSDWIERDMRQMFANRDDADEASAIAVRSFEQLKQRLASR
ncbi:MAG: hypothetical protein WA954_02520 [Parerythrobacter sp.]